MNYAEFHISPYGIKLTSESMWECRNKGLFRIMNKVLDNLIKNQTIQDHYKIRINTADGPTRDKRPSDRNFIEFDTGVEGMDDSRIFPDYVFGNWSHIGLVDFDEFVEDICENNSTDRIEDDRLFWIGNLQGIQQRIKYVEIAKNNPTKLIGDVMHWTDGGSKPTKFVPTRDYCRFRYLIDLTGQACSGRLKLLPFCYRPLFISERRFWSWSDILILKQGLHLSVRDDLGDLLERYEWAKENRSEAESNSSLLLDFCRRNLNFEKACERATQLVSEAIDEIKIRSVPRKKIKVNIVVAHYKENLDWLEKINDYRVKNIFVYTKGENIPNVKNDKAIVSKLNNVGRESHTYLHHCVSQYDSMKNSPSDFVFFLQGSPHGMETQVISDWIDCVADNGFDHTLNFRMSSPLDFLSGGRCPSWAGLTEPSSFDVRGWCENFVRRGANLDRMPIFWNACFGVATERILSNPVGKYSRISEGELSSMNPECGHYCERLWYYIFNMDKGSQSLAQDDLYEFWGGHDGKSHYGTMRLNPDGKISLYRHHNESFWSREGDSIVVMNKSMICTCRLLKVREGEYEGNYIGPNKAIHRLVSLAGQSPARR